MNNSNFGTLPWSKFSAIFSPSSLHKRLLKWKSNSCPHLPSVRAPSRRLAAHQPGHADWGSEHVVGECQVSPYSTETDSPSVYP